MHRSLLVGAAALLMGAGVAQAQMNKPQTRQGLNVSLGLGGGSGGMTCDGCQTDRTGGGTMYLNVGGTVMPNLTLGGEINGWSKDQNDASGTIASLMAVAHYYPMARAGWYMTGGLGMTTLALKDKTTGDKADATGFGMEIGTGYDWRVASNFSLSPYFQYVYGAKGELKVNDTDTGTKAGGNYFQFGLGFTWH